MKVRFFLLVPVLLCSVIFCLAGEVTASLFAKTPAPGSGEFISPRVLAVDPATSRCFVLDSGLEKIIALDNEGQQTASWMLKVLGVEMPLPADPLLPNPALAIAGKSVYLMNIDNGNRRVELVTLEGPGDPRTVTLPREATHGAVALDSEGRLLTAYMQINESGVNLMLAREGEKNGFNVIDTLANPCDNQNKNLLLTGFVIMPDGQLAIGIAQSGSSAYSYVKSWLIQGSLRRGVADKLMTVTHRMSLLNPQGNVQDKFLAMVSLAGRYGYAARPCVPLFTSMVITPDGHVISGGHTLDPFLRVYRPEDDLEHSISLRTVGGQHLAILADKRGVHLLTTSSTERRLIEMTQDGRICGGLGCEVPYNLSRPVSMAANSDEFYVAVREEVGFRLICFSSEGDFRWAQPLMPPDKLTQAVPVLTSTEANRVFIGWQFPRASGVGWVETVLSDGSKGVPLWADPSTKTTAVDTGPCTLAISAATDNRVYVMREMNEGVRLQAYSATGAFLMQYPAAVKGLPFISSTVGLTWLRSSGNELWFVTSSNGKEQRWKRIPREGKGANFLPTLTGKLWGWLSSTKSLLKFDEKLTLVDELRVFDDDGLNLDNPLAVTGDGDRKIYIAVPDRILVVNVE